MLILAWPSMRVTGSMMMRFDMVCDAWCVMRDFFVVSLCCSRITHYESCALCSSKFQLFACLFRRGAGQQLRDQRFDPCGGRRTAGQKVFDVDQFMHRQHAF